MRKRLLITSFLLWLIFFGIMLYTKPDSYFPGYFDFSVIASWYFLGIWNACALIDSD